MFRVVCALRPFETIVSTVDSTPHYKTNRPYIFPWIKRKLFGDLIRIGPGAYPALAASKLSPPPLAMGVGYFCVKTLVWRLDSIHWGRRGETLFREAFYSRCRALPGTEDAVSAYGWRRQGEHEASPDLTVLTMRKTDAVIDLLARKCNLLVCVFFCKNYPKTWCWAYFLYKLAENQAPIRR